LARWRLRLAEFEFTVKYRPGIKNSLADGCSRVTSEGGDKLPCDDDIPTFLLEEEISDEDLPEHVFMTKERKSASVAIPSTITLKELLKAQKEDPDCQAWAKDSRLRSSKFFIEGTLGEALLYRLHEPDGSRKIAVPLTLRSRLLHLSHYPVVAGHPGSRRMQTTMIKKYYWPGLSLDVATAVSQCHHCVQEASGRRKRRQEVTLFPADGLLEFVSIDLLGPQPKTPRGNQFLLIMCDRFSKLVRTVCLKSITSLTVA
jgi:hypothetical protein